MPNARAPIDAWHFVKMDRHLQYKPFTLVEEGQTLSVTGRLELCARGLHASRRVLDALQFAPGPVVCRVRLSGEILDGTDKLCARSRTVLWLADATAVLHEFGCWCAEEALKRVQARGEETDPRSWAAIEAKRAWLRGEITDDQLAAAGTAARAAAWAAAGTAAGDAAWAAARAAAGDAAWAAAGAAFWAAAGDAAGDAAWAALNEELEKRLMALAPSQAAA